MDRNDMARALYYRTRWISRPAAAWLANRVKTSENVWYGNEGWDHLQAAVDRLAKAHGDEWTPLPAVVELPMPGERPPLTMYEYAGERRVSTF